MSLVSPVQKTTATGRKLLLAMALIASITAAYANAVTGQVAQATQARNETIVREAFEGWAAGRGNVFDLLAPDVRWTIHGSGPVAGTYHGVDEFLQRASAPLVTRLSTPIRPVVHHIWAVGDRVIIRFDGSATTTSGAAYRNQFVWIFRMEGGSVVEAEAFLDLVAYQQVIDNNEPRRQ
ncbi:nuclear transport factor 2 family protein [[Pseudomonas] boreopolis]|uniref:nuclear transport factor 2 family protein n=1 Tax=Xanthomonas boreopolis TaxID=86183 RepID=UPI003D9B4C1E